MSHTKPTVRYSRCGLPNIVHVEFPFGGLANSAYLAQQYRIVDAEVRHGHLRGQLEKVSDKASNTTRFTFMADDAENAVRFIGIARDIYGVGLEAAAV